MTEQVDERQLDALGTTVFGCRERYAEWLRTPNISLSWQQPDSLLSTQEGRYRVYGLLVAIKESFCV